jgi:hypothetical protein
VLLALLMIAIWRQLLLLLLVGSIIVSLPALTTYGLCFFADRR